MHACMHAVVSVCLPGGNRMEKAKFFFFLLQVQYLLLAESGSLGRWLGRSRGVA